MKENHRKERSLELLYEPTDELKDNAENIIKILEEVPSLSLLLDIGHANLFGRQPEIMIEKLFKKIKHVHLHDNKGESDLHLPLGCGKIEWVKVLRVLKRYYDGTITLEIFSKERDYVLLSREKLKQLWETL